MKGRQLVKGEVRRYIDPIILRQIEFNASVVRLLINASQQNIELENAFTRLKQETDNKIKNSVDTAKTELDAKIETRVQELDTKIETRVQELDTKIETRVQELDAKNKMQFQEWFSQLDADIHARASLAHVLEERIQKEQVQKGTVSETINHTNTNYFLFEERFRGSRDAIKQRQLSFLHYFENCSRVLDIGCGRGEFLQILRDYKIGGMRNQILMQIW